MWIHKLQVEDNWTEIANLFIDAAKRLEGAGSHAIIFVQIPRIKYLKMLNLKLIFQLFIL